MKLLLPRQTPWNTLTEFKPKIQAGVKIHHFVEGDFWKPGMIIHFFSCDLTENVRNENKFIITKKEHAESWMNCDYAGTGFQIEEPVCYAVEDFYLKISSDIKNEREIKLRIGEFWINKMELLDIVSMGEGFNSSFELIEWFSFLMARNGKDSMTGQIVHWTDKLFDCRLAKTMNEFNHIL